MIEVENLVKDYGPVRALNGISFRVEKGDVVGFLGPNGAGKSTALRILTCYLPASSGRASVDGHDCFTDSLAVRQRIGYLPESNPLYPEMRVHEYLHFRGQLRGLGARTRQTRLDYVSARCRLTEFVDRPIANLSKGMRQRVGLAEALLHDPPVLVLDEPTVGLDPSQIIETRKLIGDLASDHTVILSSHILPEVEATCKRIIIIAAGKIVACGTLNELKNQISSGGRVVVEVNAELKTVQSRLSAMKQVQAVETSPADSDPASHWVRAVLTPMEGADIRQAVAGEVRAAGWPLRELRLLAGTLEDYFIRITAQQKNNTVAA